MWARLLFFSMVPFFVQGTILSMDMCADHWVLDHYAPEQILAVTYLSNAHESLHRHRGTTEEILRLKPSMIVSEFPLSPHKVHHLKKHKITLKTLAPLDRFDDLYKRFPNTKPQSIPSIGLGKKALIITQNLHTPGQETFWGDLLEKLGFINIAAVADIKGWGYVSSEKILALNPEVLIVFGEKTTVPPCLKTLKINYIHDADYLCPSPQGIMRIIEALQ